MVEQKNSQTVFPCAQTQRDTQSLNSAMRLSRVCSNDYRHGPRHKSSASMAS